MPNSYGTQKAFRYDDATNYARKATMPFSALQNASKSPQRILCENLLSRSP